MIDRICDYLSVDDLKQTLTVSRNFQYASERASGVYTSFELTEENGKEFVELFSGRRSGYLRQVVFRCTMPPYVEEEEDVCDEEEDGENGSAEEGNEARESTHRFRESACELQEKDELFTKQINLLFSTLQALEKRVKRSGKLNLTIYTPVREVQAPLQRKFISWRLHLLSPTTLPQLASIRGLSVENGGVILPLEEDKSLLKLDLRVLIDLAVKLPNLEYLSCKLGSGEWTSYHSLEAIQHYTRDAAGPRRDSRHDFAKALEVATLPSKLREARLDFLSPLFEADRIDHREEMPDLVSPATHDPFSSSLRLLSQHLRKLQLTAVADETLFWPADGGEAFWPCLEILNVMFHIASPSGLWYFDGPKGIFRRRKGLSITEASYPPLEDTSDDEHWYEWVDDHGLDTCTITDARFRVVPNDDVLVPFLASFARAACKMRSLKEACIWTTLYFNRGIKDLPRDPEYDNIFDKWRAWGIAFVAPSIPVNHCFPGEGNVPERQLWWVTPTWRPDEELQQLFKQIGGQDTELVEHWDKRLPFFGAFEFIAAF